MDVDFGFLILGLTTINGKWQEPVERHLSLVVNHLLSIAHNRSPEQTPDSFLKGLCKLSS